MNAPDGVLVVGASAAGLATAEALRRKGYLGALTVLGAEPHLPYDRPPLSKQVLAGTCQPDRAQLRRPDVLSALDATFVLGDPAVSLDSVNRTVHTSSGLALTAEAVVVATGLRPRTLPGQDGLAGVHVLRTLDDALALRKNLLSCPRMVVVGDGVLGVELRLGTAVTGLSSHEDRVTGVCLETGEVLPADVVVVAFGAAPATEWLADSGLPRDNGIVCDSRCRAADGIYAVGDVARWHHETLNALLRLENRTNATEQGIAVAGTVLGDDEPYTPVPYFWTDQFDVKIHVHGVLSPDAEVTVVDGDVADNRFVATYRHGGIVTGVLGWNMPKQARLHRQEIGNPALAGGKP